MSTSIQKEIRKKSNKKRAEINQRFFKTGKGEYGYGDVFLGIRVPELRKIAKANVDLSITNTQKLIQSKYHEERLTGLIILVNKYNKAKSASEKQKIYKHYIGNFKYINNWDLVDVTCPHVIGQHLYDKDRKILYKWVKSKDLWTKRISIITTLWFIRQNDLDDAFRLSKALLHDEHDLIHKAVGWVLREAGKKDLTRLEKFLKVNHNSIPRTTLRYAIEKFPESKRQKYLKGKI